MQVLFFGFMAKAQQRTGLHPGGLYIHAVLFEPRSFPSDAVSCLCGEYRAWCERRSRILAGPGPGPGVSILSSVRHFIYHPSLEDSVKSLRFPVTQTDSVLEERVRMKRLLRVILSPNEERMIKPVYSGICWKAWLRNSPPWGWQLSGKSAVTGGEITRTRMSRRISRHPALEPRVCAAQRTELPRRHAGILKGLPLTDGEDHQENSW